MLVAVRAAGINPGEAAIREGALAEQFPSTFPSGQGSDLAGVIEEVGVEDRIRAAAPSGVDAFVDTYGPPYVDVALGLGVATGRINTIIDFAAVAEHGVLSEGNAEGANVRDLTEMATRIADGRLEMPIAATYPLDEVQDAYREVEQRHTRGKIVLVP